MKKTALTYETITRFEREFATELYTDREVETIEYCAYVANMNGGSNPEWTDEQIFKDFLRVLRIERIAYELRIIRKIRAEIHNKKTFSGRSAWDKGVTDYADEFVDNLAEAIEEGYFYVEDLASKKLLEKFLLNGAENWREYSWGGCSLIYDYDIAKRLCTPSELKKTDNGRRKPNKNEMWLDVQKRALYQAHWRVIFAVENVINSEVK